jgi:antirestriction protein ArdC
VQKIIAASGIEVRSVGDRACYVPAQDVIYLPPAHAFDSADLWSEVALHEVGNVASVLALHRAAAGPAVYRRGVTGTAVDVSGIRRRLAASRSSAALARCSSVRFSLANMRFSSAR